MACFKVELFYSVNFKIEQKYSESKNKVLV